MANGRRQGPAGGGASDHVDRLRAQWAREMPSVDTEGMAVLGRARRLTLMLRRDIEAVFERHGLDAGEFDVLATLRRAGAPFELRPTELYRSLMVSSGGLTARLDRLERAGLVRRAPSSEDGRSLRVRLTAKGRERIEAAFCEDMAVEARALEALGARERAELARLLRKLTLALEPPPDGAPAPDDACEAPGG
jgi:DNA-binding MarR family transcriptional regulator